MTRNNCNLTIREIIYILAVVLKILVELITLSVIPFMIGQDICNIAFKIMTYSSYCLVLASFALSSKISFKEIELIILLFVITAIGSVYSGNGILLTLIYIYGAKDINIEKVFSVIGKIYVAIFLMIIVFSKLGIIENWVFFQTTVRPRWGLGFTYPTHTSSVMFVAVLIVCYLRKEKFSIFELFFIEAFNYWVFMYTDSRAGMALSMLAPLVFYVTKYINNKTIRKCSDWIKQFSFILCAIMTCLATAMYAEQGLLLKINNKLSNRLDLGKKALDEYGIHLLGQRIQWVGWGGIGHTQVQLRDTYNYVDTSYLKLLLENGLVVWLLILFLWTGACFYAYKQRNRYLLWAFAFLAVYSMVEQWLMVLGANPFVVFLSYFVFQKKSSLALKRMKTFLIKEEYAGPLLQGSNASNI